MENKLSKNQKYILDKMKDGYQLKMGNGAFLNKGIKSEKVNRNSVFGLSTQGYIKFHSKRFGMFYGYYTLT